MRAVRLAGLAALRGEPAGPVRGTALLVPGFTGSKEDFIALLEPLAEAGFRTVAVDQRGQYESGGPADPEAYSVRALGADVRALSAELGADGPLHLLGHSFGGQVVREAVLSASGDLPWESLTLLSTGPGAIDPAEAARTELLLSALESMDLESIWQVMQQMEGEKVPPLAPEIAEFLHRRWVANRPQALRAMAAHLVAAPDRVDELAAVGLRTLVMSGERDYAWPVPEQSLMAERLGALRTVVAGAGHSPNAERPAETAAALAAFWSA
ncbi:putative peptidase S33 family protein [Kitasatospora cheerisanensis KCTC 2395]|uniref:Putative peptidase S33 family protein n=1 Tax=Kitasatospora cheerisanensis KCTC 2395 TaxID=1348663 RepID=A0A066YTP3_9ACTN|nr:putative peptidase S33 family protein [Kitasatospora cheerisanensis KCTC 2395]